MEKNQQPRGNYAKPEKVRRANVSSLLYGKIPPQDLKAESVVLGAILVDKNALMVAQELLHSPDVFYSDANQKIYEAVLSAHSKGQSIDLITVAAELECLGNMEIIGGMYYLSTLTISVVSGAHTESHSRIILERFMAREGIRIGMEMAAKGYDYGNDVFDVLNSAEDQLFELQHRNVKSDAVHISQAVLSTAEQMDMQRNQKSYITGITTGFKKLDQITGGWQKSTLNIFAARPGMGKTAFGLNITTAAAQSIMHGGHAAFFSLEMSKSELIKRIIADCSDVDYFTVLRPVLRTSHEEAAIQDAMQRIAGMRIHIDDTAGLSVRQLRAKARRLKQKHDIQIIIIDYLQLMTGDVQGFNREQEVSKISGGLKALAKELEIPVVAFSQLNRGVDTRADNEPKLSDLRESGSIEQDADIVGFLYRPSKKEQDKDPLLKNTGSITIAKHRAGTTDYFPMMADMSRMRWSDPAPADWKSGPVVTPSPLNNYYEPERQVSDTPEDLPF